MLRRILFVDDEPNILTGLERALRTMRTHWDMVFVSSGVEALQALALDPFDAVLTDMRMPGVTGAQLLDKVRDQFPQTIRIVLSGQSDRESMVRSISSAHQYMSKPCNTDQLKSVLERIIGSTDALDNEVLKSFIFRLKNIPSLPSLYEEVTKELRSKTPSASRLSGIISQDMAMTAKLLQMVNNPVYCVDASVSSASQAVLLLGVETIQAMALSLGMFSAIDPQVLSPHKARHLWEHSIVMGKLSTLIAKAEGVAATDLGVYQSAGLLHDIGKLVMASANPSEYRMIENLAISTGTDQCKMESQTAGHNHAEVGACLLNLWGLPSPIVEATAWHHNPSASSVNKFSPLAAVHVANALHATMSPEFKHWDAELDLVFLERIGLANRQEIWMKLLREQFADGRSGDLSVPTVTPVNRRFS